MPLIALSVTTITCDGSEESACPDEAAAVHKFPQRTAIGMARKEGWLIGTDFLCPACSLAAPVNAMRLSDQPAAPGARALNEGVLH